jgi:uncharacterized protein (TIGR02588 family)
VFLIRAQRIEWIAGAFSGLIVAGMIGFFAYEAIFAADSLPDLRVTLDPSGAEDGAALRYRIANNGDRAASRVTLSVSFPDGARRQVLVDHVPAHSEVTGGLYLPERTRSEDFELSVDGYVDP